MCLSVHSGGGGVGGGIPGYIAGFQVHTQRGSWGVWPGGGFPGPHLGGVPRHTPRGYPSMHWGRHPPSRRLLLRTVRILLECILEAVMFQVSPPPTEFTDWQNITSKFMGKQDCIPVGCVPPACCLYLPACTALGGLLCGGWVVYPSMQWGRPLPLWTESQTRVKTSPSPNFVAGGKKQRQPLRRLFTSHEKR